MPSRVAPQDPLIERLRSATSINALVRFLHDELNWPVDLDAIDDAFYDYEPEELGIKVEHQVAIQSIKQLRPLTSGQPWGIFFVEFDRQKLPMVVLRRVLQGLSLRNREKDKGRQRWHARDLLFISSFGPANDREIALAHFTDETDHGDLPTLRVLGWDGADTNLALAQVATTLREHLRWPADGDTPTGQQRWRERWSSAFRLRYREAVTTAKDLALALAYLARAIRTRANEVLAVEGPDGPLTKLFVAFKANLMADLSHDRFADMYAQTITYGLFAARVSRGSGGLVADDAALMIPSTNPFLQELLQDFLAASGRTRAASRRGRGTGIDFDELGVNAVVEQLRAAPMDAVLVSFNNARPGDDPVIHFYEDFLKAYDKAMRVERGVFYTPRPVVQFIVRSVHEVLQTEFGIEDGLASTVTWAQMRQRKPELALPEGTAPESAFVQVLDPAVGTATFLVEAVDLIHGHMRSKWQKAGLNKAQQLDAWNTYVRDHLLTRLHGFELMMAPYAIAHMKLGLKLADTGYRFPDGGPRVRVYLTNSLQPASEVQPQFELMAPMLAHEARAANTVKEHLATTVIIGNPPYSKAISDAPELVRALDAWKEGVSLGKMDLMREEWKFLRVAQLRTQAIGIVAFVINRDFLDGIAKQGMRRHLQASHPLVELVDLHGDVKGRVSDENVFDIEQGVCIAVLAAGASSRHVRYGSLIGTRQEKYEALSQDPANLNRIGLLPTAPLYLWTDQDQDAAGPYSSFWPLNQVFPVNSSGVQTKCDGLSVGWTESDLMAKLRVFDKGGLSAVAEWFSPGKDSGWSAANALADLRDAKLARANVVSLLYKPFDTRKTFWTGRTQGMHARPRREVMRHLRGISNTCLLFNRQVVDDAVTHFFVCDSMAVHGTFYLGNKGQDYLAPLWLRAEEDHDSELVSRHTARVANVDRLFLERLQASIQEANQVDPECVLRYVYAVVYSPAYRERFSSALRLDFPRIPLPGSRRLFDSLVEIGEALIRWHLLKHPSAAAISATQQPAGLSLPSFYGSDRGIAKVAEKSRCLADIVATTAGPSGKVAINATSGFSGVLQGVWEHNVGGYQILHKWLDDRRKAGRSLSDDDIAHWRRIYAALQATQKLMLQVDEVIERHGGWPTGPGEGGAFSLDHPPPSADVLAAQAASRPRGRRRAAQPGQQSLLGGDDDPEPAPARPTPATPAVRTNGEDLDDGETMCALRAALAQAADSLPRDDLIRAAARAMGYSRTTARLADALDDAIRRAVRRGIASNERGALTLATRSIDDYERDALKAQVLAVVRAQRAWVPREDVARLLARWLGFGRTGGRIVEATESVLRSLVRAGELQAQDGAVRPA